MKDDLPDFLGGEPLSDAAPAAEAPAAAPAEPLAPAAEAAPAAEPAEPAEGPQRGPDGKFIAATPEAPAEAPLEPVAAEPAPAAPATPPADPMAPIAALMDERDKRQASERRAEAAEKEARELREWRAQQEAARNRQPIPDPTEDPEGHRRYVDQTTHAAIADMQLTHRREVSRLRAEVDHGKDVVKAAFDWADQQIQGALDKGQPSALNDQVKNHPDPIGYVVEQWKREQALTKLGDPSEIDAFLAWKAAQAGAPAAPGAPPTDAAPPAPIAAPRSSLAAAPSAGGAGAPAVADAADTFDAMFRK